MRHALTTLTALALFTALTAPGCGQDGRVAPVEVAPGDELSQADTPADSAIPDTAGATPGAPGNLWVEDATGQVAGILFRRGGDDQIGGKTIYDLVTVYHPESGLFYEVTMSDAVVRYPATTFFKGYNCDVPIGVASGGCTDCVSTYGMGLLHGSSWYRVRGGVTFDQLGPGSTIGPARTTECVSHGTSNAKGFPVDAVAGATPPTSFTAPLRVVFR